MSNAFVTEEELLWAQIQERNRERRERITTAALQGICAHVDTWGMATKERIAQAAVEVADFLIAELDKQP